jgi:hypothetical protein
LASSTVKGRSADPDPVDGEEVLGLLDEADDAEEDSGDTSDKSMRLNCSTSGNSGIVAAKKVGPDAKTRSTTRRNKKILSSSWQQISDATSTFTESLRAFTVPLRGIMN